MPPSARSRRRARARLLARLDRGGADADVLERPRSVPERRLQRIVEADLELVGPADVDHRIVGVRRHLIALARLHRLLRSEEHTSELQSLMRTSYAVFCLKKKNSIINSIAILYTNDA